MMRMMKKLTKSNYAGVNSREDAHTDHEKSEADNAPETSLGVTYVSVHNRSFIPARNPSYAQKNYLCGFSDS